MPFRYTLNAQKVRACFFFFCEEMFALQFSGSKSTFPSPFFSSLCSSNMPQILSELLQLELSRPSSATFDYFSVKIGHVFVVLTLLLPFCIVSRSHY